MGGSTSCAAGYEPLPLPARSGVGGDASMNDRDEDEDEYTIKASVLFDASYARTGTISVERETCHGCHQVKTCISIDNSEGEYSQGNICLDCASDLIERAERMGG